MRGLWGRRLPSPLHRLTTNGALPGFRQLGRVTILCGPGNFHPSASYFRNEGRRVQLVTNRGRDDADVAMERYSTGDDAAFAELYDAIAPRLLGFLRAATRDEFATEDLMQQTFLQIHGARGSFIPGAMVMPWAFAIAKRLVIDGARRRRVELGLFAHAAADDDRVASASTGMAAADDVFDA